MRGDDDSTGDCFAWISMKLCPTSEICEAMMILLVTASKRGVECATVLQQVLAEPVQLADNLRRATSILRNEEFSAVVLDDAMVDANPDAVDILLNTSGMAVPVYVNLALSNSARVAREVRLALRRHDGVRAIAMRAAESLLRSELRSAVTGILLSTQLVLNSQELPLEAEEKLKLVCQLASQIRGRLETLQ